MERLTERKILLNRFFKNDKYLYIIGKKAKIPFFDELDDRFSRKGYVTLSEEERKKAIDEIVQKISDEDLMNHANPIVTGETIYPDLDAFIGEHYYCTLRTGITLENRQQFMIDDFENFIRLTDKRTVPFLMAMIKLYREKEKTREYKGDCFIDIVNKIRETSAKGVPKPVDLNVMKSEVFYGQIGGKKCPVHIIPEEMITPMERVLSQMILT